MISTAHLPRRQDLRSGVSKAHAAACNYNLSDTHARTPRRSYRAPAAHGARAARAAAWLGQARQATARGLRTAQLPWASREHRRRRPVASGIPWSWAPDPPDPGREQAPCRTDAAHSTWPPLRCVRTYARHLRANLPFLTLRQRCVAPAPAGIGARLCKDWRSRRRGRGSAAQIWAGKEQQRTREGKAHAREGMGRAIWGG